MLNIYFYNLKYNMKYILLRKYFILVESILSFKYFIFLESIYSFNFLNIKIYNNLNDN